jgi:hypothetical protein
MVDGSIVILVTGQLLVRFVFKSARRQSHVLMAMPQVDEEQRPMNYTQTFQLARDESGQYFVFNDIFKLVYG